MIKFLSIIILSIVSCSNPTNERNNSANKNEITFDKLNIPLHWIEVALDSNEWVHFIPCDRELQKVDFTTIDNQNAISFYSGLEGQMYLIKRIRK